MNLTLPQKSYSSSIYIIFLFAFAILLCGYNLFNGFGEDADSVRIVESAIKSQQLHTLIPSRSWGYPLYEGLAYTLIDTFIPNLLVPKLLSLMLLLGTVYLLFKILTRLTLPSPLAYLLCIVFLCNPLVIISGNSILETGMSMFFLMAILYYFVCTTPGKKLTFENYCWYGVLFGLANLARPDNMLYFAAIFLFLIIRKEINILYIFISVLIFFLVGLLPYFLINYPIFQVTAVGIQYKIMVVAKNFAALFGLPLLILLTAGISLRFSSYKPVLLKVFNRKNDTFLFLAIVAGIIFLRVLKLADELEYGLLIWPIFIVLLGMNIKALSEIKGSRNTQRVLVAIAVAAFLPNLVQIYFFKEVNFNYKFSVGLTSGVLQQEKERRILNASFFYNSEKILTSASDSLRKKGLNYPQHIHYTDCDTCVVLTTVRDYKLYQKTINATGTDLSRNRIVFTPVFNISRGWRNFIKDNYMPPFTERALVLLH